MPKRRSTSSASVALQAKARAPVSVQSAPSFSILRAASATLMPSRANSRASDALNPSPAPTIRAILYFGNSMGEVLGWWDSVFRNPIPPGNRPSWGALQLWLLTAQPPALSVDDQDWAERTRAKNAATHA